VAALRLLDWNCGRREDGWRLAARHEADVLLLQEAPVPQDVPSQDVPYSVLSPSGTDSWGVAGHPPHPWRAAVAVRVDDHGAAAVAAEPLPLRPLAEASGCDVGVSRPGTVAAARLQVNGEPLLVVSVYCPWEASWSGLSADGTPGWGYPDASAHRVVSDLAALVDAEQPRHLLVAGDWNVLLGYHDEGSDYWARRFASVFDRLASLGLVLVGPLAGRPLELPRKLPADAPARRTTPTFRPEGGRPDRQLDFVLASPDLAPLVQTTALNEDEHWPSDHCPVWVELS
jgi:exonuclease III